MPCALTAVCETVCSDGDWKRMGSGCYSNVGLWGLLSSLCFLQCSHAAFMFVSKGGASRCLGAAVWALPIWLVSFLCTVWSPQPMCVPTGTHAHARVHTPTHTHTPFFFFKIFFLCEPFFKVFIESITTCFCFMFWIFGPKACGLLAPPSGLGWHTVPCDDRWPWGRFQMLLGQQFRAEQGECAFLPHKVRGSRLAIFCTRSYYSFCLCSAEQTQQS